MARAISTALIATCALVLPPSTVWANEAFNYYTLSKLTMQRVLSGSAEQNAGITVCAPKTWQPRDFSRPEVAAKWTLGRYYDRQQVINHAVNMGNRHKCDVIAVAPARSSPLTLDRALSTGAIFKIPQPEETVGPPQSVEEGPENNNGPSGDPQTTGRGWLGIKGDSIARQRAAQLGLRETRGFIITQITPGGPASRSPLRVDDVILAVNDSGVNGGPDLASKISAIPAGTTTRLQIWRNRRNLEVSVKLGARPTNPSSASTPPGSGGDGAPAAPAHLGQPNGAGAVPQATNNTPGRSVEQSMEGMEPVLSKLHGIPLVDGRLIMLPAQSLGSTPVYGLTPPALARRWQCLLTRNDIVLGQELQRHDLSSYLKDCADQSLQSEITDRLRPIAARAQYLPKSFGDRISRLLRIMDEFEYKLFAGWIKPRLASSTSGKPIGALRISTITPFSLGNYEVDNGRFYLGGQHRPSLTIRNRRLKDYLHVDPAQASSILAKNRAESQELANKNNELKKHNKFIKPQERLLWLITHGRLEALPLGSGSVVSRATLYLNAESVSLAHDPEGKIIVMPVSLDDIYHDEKVAAQERDREKQQQALRQERAEREANEADRRARTKRFTDRTFDVLGIRIGMTIDEAKAALLATHPEYAITPGDDKPIFYNQSQCNFQWQLLPPRLKESIGDQEAEELLFGKTTTKGASGQQILDRVWDTIKPECRNPSLRWLTVGFTARQQLGDGTSDSLAVFVPAVGEDRTVKAVTRGYDSGARTWHATSQAAPGFLNGLITKYGTDYFRFKKAKNRSDTFWLETSEVHNKLEFDQDLASLCLQGGFNAHYFRASCGVIVVHPGNTTGMYMADTTFFHSEREELQRWDADRANRAKTGIKF